MKRLFTSVLIILLLVNLSSISTSAQITPNYEFKGGWWFNGTGFVRKKLFAVKGVFQKNRPAHIDKVIELNDLYIIPPFGDAHSHAFDDPKIIESVVKSHLNDGIFYGLSLTNSIKGKKAVADKVNKPSSLDVAYANAGLTATLGHPILSAEVTANGFSWDSLGINWSRLLKSNKAEGDFYFVIDNLSDLQKKWSQIQASKPDIIKIYLFDTENFEQRRQSTNTIDDKGLDPAIVPAIVAKAHLSKIRVAAHVETAADFRVAVKANVDLIAHLPGLAPKANENSLLYEITDADAILAKKKGVSVVATAWLAERLATPKPWLSGAAALGDTAQLERAKQIQRLSFERLIRQDVPIGIGSDLFENAGSEALYMQSLGIFDSRTLLRLWSQTTSKLIFPKRRIGQLTSGYEASLLALACDPITNFACVRQITLRVKQGRLL